MAQSLEFKYSKYDEAFELSADLIPEVNAKLIELDAMIASEDACTAGAGFRCAHRHFQANSLI